MTTLEVGLVTSDAARLVRFYEDGCGFVVAQTLEFPQGSVHRLRRDDAQIKIHQPIGGAESRGPIDPWYRYRGICYAALHVDDIEAEVGHALRAGAALLTPITNHRPGASFALIADPDGNVWEILQETTP